MISDFAAGANQEGKHWFGLNWERDLPQPEIADLRNVVAGDPSPDGQGVLEIKRGIEVGHIFQLGTNTAKRPNSPYGENGKACHLTMGAMALVYPVWWRPPLSKTMTSVALSGPQL